MMPNVWLFPFRYLALRTESGSLLLWRDVILVAVLAAMISIPFIIFNANFFAPSGFLQGLGSLVSVLAGFYIASLVAVATFATSLSDTDSAIQNGKILLRDDRFEEKVIELTRREYVCRLFGYLAASAMVLASVALFCTSALPIIVSQFGNVFGANKYYVLVKEITSSVVIVIIAAQASHLIVTTFHGLYYLIDRLYHRAPEIKSRHDRD